MKYLSKYKEKKTVKDKDGEERTVYEYSERQVNKRHKEKSKKVEKIRKSIDDLERTIYKDIASGFGEGSATAQTALAVALINHTYERVGNDESAANGHYGVTGWKKKHLSFKGGVAVLKYTGKSGVRHQKDITDKKLVKALKEISKGLSSEDCLLKDVSASDVNDYLDSFDFTAKDIRGYHANREMQERLKALREENGELPTNRKEKKETLTKEFQEALKGAAKAVGHEEATLRNQYLVPHLEETYMKDGTVITTLKKSSLLRIAQQVFATKSESEKEEEEVERLVRPSPKLKPSRKDRKRNRMEVEDKDIDKDPDLSSKDMSMNYKVVGGSLQSIQRVAYRYLRVQSLASRYLQAKEEEEDKKQDEDMIQARKEGWEKFTQKKITDPKTQKDVSWSTFEGKYPDQAKAIRDQFNEKFEKDFKGEKETKEKEQEKDREDKEQKKLEQMKVELTEEEKSFIDPEKEQVVNLGGRELKVPAKVSENFQKTLDILSEEKKAGESATEYTERKQKEIVQAVNQMKREDIRKLVDAGVLNTKDPRIGDALSKLDNKEEMEAVIGREMTEEEKAEYAALYESMVGQALSSDYFPTKDEEDDDATISFPKEEFTATFVDNMMTAIQDNLKENPAPKTIEDSFSDAMKSFTSQIEKGKQMVKMLKYRVDNKELRQEIESLMGKKDTLLKEKQKATDIISELKGSDLPEDKKKVEEAQAILKSFEDGDLSLEVTALTTRLNRKNKDYEKDKPLSKSEMLEKYKEVIKNSKTMSKEEIEKALDRAEDPDFDPEGALVGIFSKGGEV